jgi:hypothetical protein
MRPWISFFISNESETASMPEEVDCMNRDFLTVVFERGFMLRRFVSIFRRISSVLLALGVVFSIASEMQAQNLQFTPGIASTIAGDVTGSLGFSANNYTGPASGLLLRNAYGINLDSAGNIYIASRGIIRVIAAGSQPIPAMPGVIVQAGNVYTFAGGGTVCPGSTDTHGDGCPATQATVSNTAEDMAVDAQGNVFIADQSNEEIRVVYAGGTIPGLTSPQPGYIYSLAAAATYFTQISDQPFGIAVDAQENIYFTNSFSSALSVIYSGQTALGNPLGIPASTPVGGVYTINNSNCSAEQPVCGDGGPFAQAQLATPVGVAVDSSGNLYFGDSATGHLRVVYAAGNIPGLSNLMPGNVYTVAGGGTSQTIPAMGEPATSASNVNFGQIAVDAAGDLYLAEGITATIEKVDASGTLTTVFGGSANCAASTDGYGDGCPATSATFVNPFSVAVDSGGNIYVSDNQTHGLIRKSTVSSSALSLAGTAGLPLANQTGIVSNAGSKPLQLSDLNFSGPFAQTPSGGSNDCASSTSLAPGASCAVAIAFNSAAPGQFTGALNVASNSLNATGGNNTIALSGTIAQATTSTALTSNAPFPIILNAGQSVTFTAMVAPQVGDSLTPTGTVTLLSGSTQVGTGTLTNGVATVQIGNLPAGNLLITAQYNGDTNFTGSTSFDVPVSVASASAPVAEVALAASTDIATSGQSVTLMATVTTQSGALVTSGTVTFQDGDNPLGAAAAVNGSGVATFVTSILPIGNNPLIAVFNGTTGYSANFSNSVTVTINGGGELSFTPGVIEKVAGIYPTITNSLYGQPDQGYSGDGGSAVNATLDFPRSAAADSFGNVYIVDSGNNVIRVIASGKGTIAGISNAQAGNIYTFAGGGTCSPAPCDGGGSATQAQFSSPGNVAVDVYGNVYVTDGGNGGGDAAAVRRINPQGIIQTVAGSLTNGSGYGGDNGPATSAQISVNGIFADNAGNLYLADGGNNIVRRVDALTGIITTVAGTPQTGCSSAPCGDGGPARNALLSSPGSVALDSAGNLYIADTGDQVVRRVDAKTGLISTVAGSYGAGEEFGGFTGGYGGDGGAATSAQLNNPITVTVDNAGNLYILDAGNQRVRVVNAQTGMINTIVGGGSCIPSSGPCGDGGLATNAQLDDELGAMGMDSQGNLYVVHSERSVIREVPVATTAINFGSQNDGTSNAQTFTVTNIGAQPLNFSGLTVANTSPVLGPSPSDFSQQPSGSADCTSDISLAAGGTCNIEVQWFPTINSAETATFTVASNADNATSGNNVITASGSGLASNGSTTQTITFPTLPASVTYGQTISLGATASSGLPISYRISGPGKADQTAGTLTVIGSGAITVTAYQFGNALYAAAAPVPQMTTSAGGAVLTVTANSLSINQGSAIPTLTYTLSGLENGDTTTGAPSLTTAATQNSPIGNYPISAAQGTLTAPAAYQVNFVPGTLYITGTGSQTITFNPISAVTYGTKPITLGATASSKLPVTFIVASGPGTISGNTLTITGAGQIIVNANQYGDTTYAAAPIVSQTITVSPAPLTVSANSISIVQGEPIPALTGYTVNTAQLQNGDTQAVLSGTPAETTTATQSSTPGAYPINITVGSLTAANYTLNFAPGTLTIIIGQTQTISFAPIANVTYGALPIMLDAKTSSGLGVTYLVTSGPATVAGNILTITGAGTVQVTATQPGAGQYGPAASVSQTLTVAPAVLTLTANNATRMDNTVNPPFTYTLTGFVNGDTQGSATSGQPQITTTATPGSPVGTYPIIPAATYTNIGGIQTALSAANYTFNPVNGTLTITSGGPAGAFTLTATPQQLTVVAGDFVQTTVTLNPQNYYQGLVTLSCGTLPKNVQCIFTPATVSPDGTATTQTTTLTISTTTGSTIVAGLDHKGNLPGGMRMEAAMFYLPGTLMGLLLMFRRKQLAKKAWTQQLMLLAVLLTGLAGLAACGGSSSSASSTNAAPGTYSITVTAKGQDGTTNTVPVSIQVL